MSREESDYLSIDIPSLSNERLAELTELFKGSEQHRNLLVALRSELVARLRKQAFTTQEIVKCITRGRNKADRDLIAKDWSEVLGGSDREFRKIANQR